VKQSSQAEGLYVTAALFITAGVWIEAGPGNALTTFGIAMLFGAICKWLLAYLDGEDR
jgi:uncharacterized membrane protein YhiD involved in acid resistance